MKDYIEDYATGKKLIVRPEEHYRQEFEHYLIDELGYPKKDIDIEVPLQRGSNKKSEAMDIVVYAASGRHVQDNIRIVVEIKRPGIPYDGQLKSYTTATTAPYAAWYQGYDADSYSPRYFYRDMKKDPTKFNDILQLPHYGERFDEIGKYRKDDLQPAKNLKSLFQRIHFYLYGNSEIKREEDIAEEFIKILFCKILDETLPDEMAAFRVTPSELETEEGKTKAVGRIKGLYSELCKNPSFSDMFTDDKINLDDESIIYVVSELQEYALLDPQTNTDALGDAYEIFLPATLKGDSGQFFTPREIVRFAIGVMKPSWRKHESIFDPACGSGGFLSIGLENIRKQMFDAYKGRNFSRDKMNSLVKEYAKNHIYGSDIDPLLYRIAKSYMAIIGDGKSNIVNEDSLKDTQKLPLKFNKADVILTNPPFGTKIDIVNKDTLDKYDLGHKLNEDGTVNKEELLAGQDPDKLFLDLNLKFLKEPKNGQPGGRMAIVLPKEILSGTEGESIRIRKWLLKKARILGVVDLPREAFQPYTGTKTSLVFLEKNTDLNSNYPIFMSVSNTVGHDRRGKAIYVKDNSGEDAVDSDGNKIIDNDLPKILDEWNQYEKNHTLPENSQSFLVNVDDIKKGIYRFDAWYYDPHKNKIVKKLEDSVGNGDVIEIQSLRDVALDIFYPGRHKRNYVEPSKDSVPFYSGTQILQARPYDLKYQPRDYKPAQHHFVKKGWILVTRSGSTGRVVMVGDNLDNTMVTEHVIRVIADPQQIDPYYLYAYLSSTKIGKTLLDRGIYASVVDHISPQFVASLPIARLKPEKEKEIANKMKKSLELEEKAIALFKKGNQEIDDNIL
ncbi:N-6 DNA methylase [Lactobacillus amylovorus]|uniref:N-6 DNA methylase n=1 Tax=Lactobacillus amylovorus TaxID=1604 RepID=UPI003F89AAF5